ncbi:hypothetical protein PHLCEN_2v11400 [Hermanssonia centrifuga]|uniref:Uncharacterized protein n=1 Tax=Hermanssonia centrifuga TaxID=98765 RepID=A0A2R6NJZ7_9APHY|nr:hypothetical protein PHLCEN_2v11400 [Hermanssonia centrifuga]
MPTLVPSNPETLDPKLLAKFLTMVTSTLRNMDNEAYGMIQTEMLSCQGDPAGRLQTAAEPSIPAESVMSRLDKELEDMVLESVLRSQPGPMQNAIETVLERYRKQEALSTRNVGTLHRAPLPTTPTGKSSRAVERVLVDVASGGTPEGLVRGRSLSL